jgi:hypothetical protein
MNRRHGTEGMTIKIYAQGEFSYGNASSDPPPFVCVWVGRRDLIIPIPDPRHGEDFS